MSYLEVALMCFVVVGVCASIAKYLFKKDTEREDRKRGAVKMAAFLSGLGMKDIPAFLMDYAVDDWSGMAKRMSDLGRLLLSGNESAVLKEFERVFDGLIDAKLATDVGRAYVAAKLSDAARSTDPSVVLDAPKAGVL